MNLRFWFNLLGILLVYHTLVFYIGWNGWVWLTTVIHFDHMYLYVLGIGFLSYSYFSARFGPRFTIFKIIGAYWMAVVQYALILLPIADFIVMLLYFWDIPMETSIFWTGTFTIINFLIILAYGTFNAYSPVVRTYEFRIPKKAGHLKNLRIAMASDMHFGTLSGKAHLQRLVKGIIALKPDLILLPGDIIDDEPTPFIQKKMGEVMKKMKAPLGIYGVLGNHEYYGGRIPEFLEQMKAIDVNILMDEVVKVEDCFYIIGRKDRTDKNRKTLEELLTGAIVDKTVPLILMDHQPYHLDQAVSHGIDVMLSGHTHRGQMAPNHLITKKMYELDWGYLKKNDLHVVVSSGFGFWGPPLRIGSRSEIVQINIHFD